jgi:hypothetical protein
LTKFAIAVKTPNVDVSEQEATSMVAFGAAALAHSASMIASPSLGLV